jgi:uroporphyrinogen-III decarboxylase
MTSKEIVEKTLSYQYPERVARSFGGSDFVLVKADVPQINGCELPDYSDPADYKCVAEERAKHTDKWLIGDVPGFTFGVARYILRLENYLTAIMLERERVRVLHNRIDVILEQMIRNYAAAGADCIFFSEDWGTQNQLLIQPQLWYEEFFWRFQKLCLLAHQCGIKVFMHSCGQIGVIIPGLMKAGVDVLQFDQPDLYGIETLAGYQQQGRVTFWCPVDIQKTLQTGDEKVIRSKAREMLDRLWKGRGGFIAGYYADNASIGLDPKWQDYACQEFLKCGRRRS